MEYLYFIFPNVEKKKNKIELSVVWEPIKAFEFSNFSLQFFIFGLTLNIENRYYSWSIP